MMEHFNRAQTIVENKAQKHLQNKFLKTLLLKCLIYIKI